ncbi:hypothetical protein H1R20_g11642, partial [Candolleomyces eurysporus]
MAPNKENRRPATASAVPSNEDMRRQLLGKRKAASDSDDSNRDEDGEVGPQSEITPQAKIVKSDVLVSYGRHFNRTIHPFCDLNTLIVDGQTRVNEVILRGITIEALSLREQREHGLFLQLIQLVPGLDARLWDEKCTNDDRKYIADTLGRGVRSGRADDAKGLKPVVIDWVTPLNGMLIPPVGKYLCPTDYNWNDDNDRRRLRKGEIIPTPGQWPIFLYEDLKFNPADPWEGLLKGHLVVQAYKHIFVSPSSADGETRATRSGNAAIHGMKSVTTASLAYVAMMVRFSLSASASFIKNDKMMEHESFFNTLLEFLEDENEGDEVSQLLDWWNQLIFPAYFTLVGNAKVPQTSALAQLKQRRRKILGSTQPASDVPA